MTLQYKGFVPVLCLSRGGLGPTVPKEAGTQCPGWKRIFVSCQHVGLRDTEMCTDMVYFSCCSLTYLHVLLL